jgi:hypothetical protein
MKADLKNFDPSMEVAKFQKTLHYTEKDKVVFKNVMNL